MIHVSFVGCGGMAAHYLGVYRDLDWVRVVNCIDAVPEAAQKAAESIPGAAASTDFSAALSGEIDAVIIYKVDRLSRSLFDFADAAYWLRASATAHE